MLHHLYVDEVQDRSVSLARGLGFRVSLCTPFCARDAEDVYLDSRGT